MRDSFNRKTCAWPRRFCAGSSPGIAKHRSWTRSARRSHNYSSGQGTDDVSCSVFQTTQETHTEQQDNICISKFKQKPNTNKNNETRQHQQRTKLALASFAEDCLAKMAVEGSGGCALCKQRVSGTQALFKP